MRMEKLPAPAPAAVSTPSIITRPKPLDMYGVSARPNATISAPITIIRTVPARSSSAPNTGCAAPHTNRPTAIAKLMVTIPRPVEVLSGDTRSPSDWRTPMVIIMITEVASTSGQ
jgi:hypothetical protein